MLNDYTVDKRCFAVINYRPVPVRLVERDNSRFKVRSKIITSSG